VIIDLPSTTTAAVNKALIDLRESGGAVALGRVLTLVIVTDDGDAEESIEAANDASREHPCRVIVLVKANKRGTVRLDAQVRVGGDAGASEVIVLRLYGRLVDHAASVAVPLLLPDAPVVAWWPGEPPKVPAEDPIGALAQRRITDVAACRQPVRALESRRVGYRPGDTDLAWSRTTLWRGLLAAALDQPPFERVTAATVVGGSDSPSTDLLAGWLTSALRCPVTRARAKPGAGLVSVRLERKSGPIDLLRPDGNVATLVAPGQPDRRISLPRRSTSESLAEELRRLDPDEIYEMALTKGLPKLARKTRPTAGQAARKGKAMPPQEAKSRSAAAKRREQRQAAKIGKAQPEDRVSAAS
jgi:glucose-6-phosphate dehydrogenase assembly protein OpcA